MMGRVLVTLTAALLLLAAPAVAAAQDGPYPPPEIRVENPAVTVIIEGRDWGPDTEVTIERHGASASAAGSVEVLGTTTTRPDGSFSFAADGLEPGDEVLATGTAPDGSERVDQFVVTEDLTAEPAGMAATGFAVWQALLLAAGLLVLGGVLAKVAGRKRSEGLTATTD